MTPERKKMEDELAQLLPSSRARAVYLRRDDAGLADLIDRLRADRAKALRHGHIAAAGVDLRRVERA